MPYTIKKFALLTVILIALLLAVFSFNYNSNVLPIIAIANYGPHASLDETIQGIQAELGRLGVKEDEDFVYDIQNVQFEPSLIQQMLAKLRARRPTVLVAISTPIAQAAKKIKNIPIVFSDVTDPVLVDLLQEENQSVGNLTGASDRQNLNAFLNFAKSILPDSKRIGILYATGEANDLALVKMMEEAAQKYQMEVVAIPIDKPSDIKVRMQAFNRKVDFIYVGVSGTIQPTLPIIALEANKMHIPVFNADKDAVLNHMVLGSYGVSYYQVGVNTAQIIYEILHGKAVSEISPRYPQDSDHYGYISQQVADNYGIKLPTNLKNVKVVG